MAFNAVTTIIACKQSSILNAACMHVLIRSKAFHTASGAVARKTLAGSGPCVLSCISTRMGVGAQ